MKRTNKSNTKVWKEISTIDEIGVGKNSQRPFIMTGLDLASGKDYHKEIIIKPHDGSRDGIPMICTTIDEAKPFFDKPELKTYVGIDNGVTGGITILSNDGSVLVHANTPVKKCMNYTKKKSFINRVDSLTFRNLIAQAGSNTFVMIERPMVNPTRFGATISAIRCLEATELILEELKIPYQFIDSKEWQKVLLPSGLLKGELKFAADSVAKRLYPQLKVLNSDCLLIALYCKNKMS